MARQSFIWTALPNGYSEDGQSLRLSALLSPRLDPQTSPETLQSFFPDWEDWPATLKKATFRVRYAGSSVAIPATQTTGAQRVDDRLGLPDTAAWQSLFKKDLFVRPFVFADLSGSRILSYDYQALASAAQSLYAGLAARAGDDMPTVTDLIETPGWRDLLAAVRDLDRAGFDQETGLRDPGKLFDLVSDRWLGLGFQRELARFQLFHTPPATPKPRLEARTDDPRIKAKWLEYQRTPLPTPADLSKQLDFHQYVASMGSYPTLLRRLGLVVDLVLPAIALPAAADAALTVEAEFPAGTLQIPRRPDAMPETRTVLAADRFHAVSRSTASPRVQRGLLELDSQKFSLMQIDADSVWLKVMNFARSVDRRMGSEARYDAVSRREERMGAPSLRAGGLMLVHHQRGSYLGKRFAESKTGNSGLESQFQGGGAAVSLMAEDLVRGYRIDVLDAMTGRWRSLFRRHARYALDGGALVVEAPDEEGTLQLAATKSSDPGHNSDVLYLHEAMAAWTGWSLAAPPPGRVISADDSVDTSGPTAQQELPPGIDFRPVYKPVKGSLPRLRIGRSYSVRARAVDLAGNSLPPQETDFGWETTPPLSREYLRLEPIEGPTIALLSRSGAIAPPREGEAMALMAIRSFNDTVQDNAVPTSELAWRAVAPPRVSARDAEHHGKLDVGSGPAPFLFGMLANQKDIDPREPQAAIREEKMPLQASLADAPTETYMAVYEAGRALTYLPDPLAREVVVRVFDHPAISDSELISIPLYPSGDWPDAQPFTVVARDDPAGKPYFDDATRELHVPLAKAARVRLRLSMRLSASDLQTMAVFRWMPPAAQTSQAPRAMDGQHWMLTPWRTLELVHAVQRPLVAPEITSVAFANRAASATSVRPVMQVTCSLASTDRLDLKAEWHDARDEADQAGPADTVRRDLAFHVKVTEPHRYAQRLFGDAGGGYPDHTVSGPESIGINAVASAGPSGTPAVQAKAHEFHDTRYRRIEYWFDATTRFREFLPARLLTSSESGTPQAVDDHIKVTGQRAVSWVPSSAPPPAPQVLYVVPTFGWQREVDGAGGRSRRRHGGGLRVYLDRPWNESGYGEMLAVVLPRRSFTGDPENAPTGRPYKDYVTQWGNDPAWDSAFVPGIAPTREDFPRARTSPDPAGGWLPPGVPASEADQQPGAFVVMDLRVPRPTGQSALVEIAPHDVFFDRGRRLWFCDIEIEAGASYFPFIRLALARYQPTSCPGAHLSNVVLADMMALSADRWLNLSPVVDGQPLRITVSGVRAYESSGHDEAAHSPSLSLTPFGGPVETLTPAQIARSTTIEVWLEELDERYGEDFGWMRTASATVVGSDPWAADPEASIATAKAVVPAVLQQATAEARVSRQATSLAGSVAPLSEVQQIVTLLAPWHTLWTGEMHLPPPSGRRRLVVAEYEEYLIDDSRPYDKVPTAKGRRLVFAEHVELP